MFCISYMIQLLTLTKKTKIWVIMWVLLHFAKHFLLLIFFFSTSTTTSQSSIQCHQIPALVRMPSAPFVQILVSNVVINSLTTLMPSFVGQSNTILLQLEQHVYRQRNFLNWSKILFKIQFEYEIFHFSFENLGFLKHKY